MIQNRFDLAYWQQKYENESTGWDIGHISTPLKMYFEQLYDTSISILIPGGGNSYEAEFLYKSGFKNIFILDIAKHPLYNFKQRVPDFPKDQIIHADFFNHKGKYDLIVEQTFFCALDPHFRKKYATKIYELLKKNGVLAGLLFDFPLTKTGPPFGGSTDEYKKTFSSLFNIKVLKSAYNSEADRAGKELFIIFEKR